MDASGPWSLTFSFAPVGVRKVIGRIQSNVIFDVVLELGSGFVQTFKQFLALRSLFGVAMGGIWGLCKFSAVQ